MEERKLEPLTLSTSVESRRVSTVLIDLSNHPKLSNSRYETIVFGGRRRLRSVFCQDAYTIAEARQMHDETVRDVRENPAKYSLVGRRMKRKIYPE